jgi:CRP/FNR family transcriptional regulator, cyclic AMP receptor protein
LVFVVIVYLEAEIMKILQLLEDVDLFAGLSGDELKRIAGICQERQFKEGEVLAAEGQPGDSMFVITEGFVEVLLENHPDRQTKVIINLGPGQLIGEMALLDQGPRSATVRAISDPTIVQAINRDDFEMLCQENTHIGYVAMRNLAVDLSFKLRHRNLAER